VALPLKETQNSAVKTPEDLREHLVRRAEGVLIRAKPEITRRVLRGAFAWSESWNGMERDLSIEELAKEIMQLITHE
jgi:hypothetical protein